MTGPKDRTKAKADHSQIATYLMTKYRFVTVEDTKEMYRYNKVTGLYELGGEIIVDTEVQAALIGCDSAHESTTSFISSVKDFIRRATYVDRGAFNAQDELLPVKNGVVNLKNPRVPVLEPFNPDYLFTERINANFEPGAFCPKIMRFLLDVVNGGDLDLLLEVAGWCLDINSPLQYWVLLWGGGANGKSTFLKLLRTFLGEGNCAAVSLQRLTEDRFAAADLFGKRVNICAELPATGIRSVEFLKELTGGDVVRTEKKFKDSFTFTNRAKLIFSANTAPPVKDDTLAFWRRVILIDFPNIFTGEKVDLDILAKLTTEAELSGLLNQALNRRARLRERGQFSYEFTPEQTRERYMLRSDSVAMFLEEKCLVGQDDWGAVSIGKEELYQEYCRYTRSKQLTPVTKSGFGRTLKDRLGTKISEGQDKNHHNVWRGVTLKS